MNSIRKRFPVVAFLLLHATALFAQDISGKLDTLINEYVSQYKFSGVVMVVRDGKVLLEKGYGFRDAARKIPHDLNSIFQIGSITKQFTATTVLYLQEKGKLDLHDKLSKYIPDYPGGNKITIRNLLTHTSGVYNYTNDSRFMNNEAMKHLD